LIRGIDVAVEEELAGDEGGSRRRERKEGTVEPVGPYIESDGRLV
jgi:hypothetical protein